jgi:hypothetical protein
MSARLLGIICIAVNRLHRFRSRPWGPSLLRANCVLALSPFTIARRFSAAAGRTHCNETRIFPNKRFSHGFQGLPDARWVFVNVLGRQLLDAQTYALPLSRGALLPQTPAGGFTVEADMAKISGALTIRGYAVPGPTSGAYAFMRPTAQRNLFRIPIL